MTWVKKWTVPSNTETGKEYIVSQDEDGNYGCSCPVWKFQRKECKHIQYIRNIEGIPASSKLKSSDVRPERKVPVPIEWGGEKNVWF